MSNRAPLTTEDTAGQPAPLEPGSVVPSATPGYYALDATALVNVNVAAVPNTVPIRDSDAGFEVAYLQVDTTPTVVQTGGIGKVVWNDTSGTLEFQVKGGAVTLEVGQDEVLRVRNLQVTPLVTGEVVYVTGSSGTHITVLRASAASEPTSTTTIGVVAEPIAAHPGEGFVSTFGIVTCGTNHLIEGAAVWLSTVSGQTTSTRPVAPNHAVFVGWCIKKAGVADGKIFVNVQNGYELEELHDVLITAKATGDTLYYDGSVWRNRTAAASPWVLKSGDTMSVATGTALAINSTDGLGELPIKVRVAAATTGSGQAGMDYGFNNSYRITQAVAGTGLTSPYGGSAYMLAAGVPLRFVTDNVARGIEFWAGAIYAGRILNGTTQLGAAPGGTSTTGIPLYCGRASATVQARLGDLSGNCWSFGRDNVSSGDLMIEPTVPAGTTSFAAALRVLWASGVTRTTYGLQVGASGTTLTQAVVYTPSLSPTAVTAGAFVAQNFTVTGLATTDTVTVNAPGAAVFSARVSAANTLSITFMPPATGSYIPPLGVYRILAVRS